MMSDIVVATDGKLVGLYVIANYGGDRWPFRIVGKTLTDFICHNLDSPQMSGCVPIKRSDLCTAFGIGTAEVFTSRAACMARYRQVEIEEAAKAEAKRQKRAAAKAANLLAAEKLKLTEGEIKQWSGLYLDEYDTLKKEKDYDTERVVRQRHLHGR